MQQAMSALSQAKKGSKKVDIKQLMKEKKKNVNAGTIDSPLAKYNSLGHLICIVCNCQVKSDRLWSAHILGRSHKECVERLKAGGEQVQSSNALPVTNKRKISTEHGFDQAKKHKNKALAPSRATKPLKGILKNAVPLADYNSSSDSEDEDSQSQNSSLATKPMLNGQTMSSLPADFFDSGVSQSNPPNAEEEASASAELSGKTEALPEGFFDDPKLDAKARNVVYVDKNEEEWESFQKAMKEETQISEHITEADDHINTEERHIEEIDEQMSRWSRVDKFCKKKDELMQQKASNNKEVSSDSSSELDDEEFTSFVDWRSKKIIK